MTTPPPLATPFIFSQGRELASTENCFSGGQFSHGVLLNCYSRPLRQVSLSLLHRKEE